MRDVNDMTLAEKNDLGAQLHALYGAGLDEAGAQLFACKRCTGEPDGHYRARLLDCIAAAGTEGTGGTGERERCEACGKDAQSGRAFFSDQFTLRGYGDIHGAALCGACADTFTLANQKALGARIRANRAAKVKRDTMPAPPLERIEITIGFSLPTVEPAPTMLEVARRLDQYTAPHLPPGHRWIVDSLPRNGNVWLCWLLDDNGKSVHELGIPKHLQTAEHIRGQWLRSAIGGAVRDALTAYGRRSVKR
jgi:hypothetical protein